MIINSISAVLWCILDSKSIQPLQLIRISLDHNHSDRLEPP